MHSSNLVTPQMSQVRKIGCCGKGIGFTINDYVPNIFEHNLGQKAGADIRHDGAAILNSIINAKVMLTSQNVKRP